MEDRRDDLVLAAAVEGFAPRHHFVEQGPERENIASVIDIAAREPGRCVVIDGSADPERIARSVVEAFDARAAGADATASVGEPA